MISIVYATPVAGKREYTFDNGYDLASHVESNNPSMFYGIPKTEAEWNKTISNGWRMPDFEKKKKDKLRKLADTISKVLTEVEGKSGQNV